MEVDSSAAGHEAYAAQLELRSPPAASVGEATDALAALRAKASAAGAVLLGGGLHPTGGMGEADLVPASRYERVADEMRGLLRRTPESALHVHVGLPDEKAAIAAFNALRRHLPLLQALSASSPWWFGVDSGLASARFSLARAYPGRGVPRALRDLDELEELTAATLAAAGMPESTFLWSDVRLHPRYGTVEVREMDAQSSLDDVAALAALVRAVALEARDAAPRADEPSEALEWSSFRAARDGTAATLLDGGSLRPLAEIARDTVERLRPFARELGDEDALAGRGADPRAGGRSGTATGGVRSRGMDEVLRIARRGYRRAAGRARPRARRGSGSRREPRATSSGSPSSPPRTRRGSAPSTGARRGGRRSSPTWRRASSETDEFATELLDYEARGDKAVALIRNVARRNGDELDSRQALVFEEAGGVVTSVRILVDDPEAVEAFWEDES